MRSRKMIIVILKFKSDGFKSEKEGNTSQLFSCDGFNQSFNFFLKASILLHKLKSVVTVPWRLKFNSFISENNQISKRALQPSLRHKNI